jgi:hypothetical protein
LRADNGVESIPCIAVPVFQIVAGKMLACSYNFLVRLSIKTSLEPGDQLFNVGREMKGILSWSLLAASPSGLNGISSVISAIKVNYRGKRCLRNTNVSIRINVPRGG